MARIVILGLSITSSWGNGHATTFRSLTKALSRRGHDVLFLERDVPWYAANRDLTDPPYCRTVLYHDLPELERKAAEAVRDADAVIIGSFVPEGVAAARWVMAQANGLVAFYDIDTPVTLAKLAAGDFEYIEPDLIKDYDIYLSFTGGPVLETLSDLGSPCPRALYCSVDPDLYRPLPGEAQWRLGYLGTYSADRQPTLEQNLIQTAAHLPGERFVVAGAQYPPSIVWPTNVQHIEHLPPTEHARFYCAQDYTLNITRADMRASGFSPSVRLFEAAACGVPIISDNWPGLETVLRPGSEIFIAEEPGDAARLITKTDERTRRAVAAAARQAVLARHTCTHRAVELEAILEDAVRHHSERAA